MATYTTQLRSICEVAAGMTERKGYDSVDDIISQVATTVIPQYPIFDEAYRKTLNTKILRHYYTREICAETVGLWKLWLGNKMNEIMPYYNQLYKSELLEFNPLYDVDVTTTETGNNNRQRNEESKDQGTHNNTVTDTGETTQNTHTDTDSTVKFTGDKGTDETYTGTNKNTNRFSDTPQGDLTGMSSVEDNMYLTNATIDDGTENHTINTDTNETSNTTSNQAQNGTNHVSQTNTKTDNGTTDRTGNVNETISDLTNYAKHVIGKTPGYSYSKKLNEFRETFLNIDQMIIEELEPLFFGLLI